MIDIGTLNVTQFGIRDCRLLRDLLYYATNRAIFDLNFVLRLSHECGSLIKLSRFPNGSCYVHDGHHRVIALFLAHRKFLYPQEYQYMDFDSYDRYNEVNFETGWVTPFNIREELRLPDVRNFKEYVFSLPRKEAEEYIRNNRGEYVVKRNNIFSVEDLCIQTLL